jgi:hypothetical protein
MRQRIGSGYHPSVLIVAAFQVVFRIAALMLQHSADTSVTVVLEVTAPGGESGRAVHSVKAACAAILCDFGITQLASVLQLAIE